MDINIEVLMAAKKIYPNYLGNKSVSILLARRIEAYWRIRGFPWVKIWVETEKDQFNKPQHYIRGNIKYRVPGN